MSTDLLRALSVIRGSCRYNRWIYSILEPYLSGVVLDIGSGLGDIASLFVSWQVEEVILSDCDKGLVAKLKQHPFSLPRYRVLDLDITQDQAVEQLNGERFNTITCINVLEHIEGDISALRRIRKILKPGGNVVVLVPALSCIYGTLDSCHGHLRRYSRRILKNKMQSAGFHIVSWRYMNFFGVLTWFLAGQILKQNKFSEKTCYQLDRIVPFLQRFEQMFHVPWGQSLVMVGQVPNE